MPKATVAADPIRYDLKSLEGGFVMLKQLPFGHSLSRRDRAARYLQEVNPQAKPGDISRIQIDLLQENSRRYDFSHCIVDHNLEDDHGNKLDFNNPMTLDVLDPRIGMEIEGYIDKLNGGDFDEEVFTMPSGAQQISTGGTSPEDEESS